MAVSDESSALESQEPRSQSDLHFHSTIKMKRELLGGSCAHSIARGEADIKKGKEIKKETETSS